MIQTESGLIIAPGISLGSNQFVDTFQRPDSPTLGNGWTQGFDWDPTVYERLGIYNNSVVCTQPRGRGGVYADPQDTHPDDLDGALYQGIGCAYRDFGTDVITGSTEWSGIWTVPTHTEGGPLFNVVPGTPEFGIGIWPTVVGAVHLPTIGALGNPPEEWAPSGAIGWPHIEGTQRCVQFVSDGEGITSWMDGVQLPLLPYGLEPCPIPENLLGSHLHGFCVDTHLVDVEDIPTTPVHHSVSFIF